MVRGMSRSLQWNASEIAKLMASRHIRKREAAARKLGLPATTLRRSFDENWEGESTGPILVALCRAFDVPVQRLVRDPRRHS